MLDVNSSSDNSGTSFELMAYEAERDVEDSNEEPEPSSHFSLKEASPETSKSCENRYRS